MREHSIHLHNQEHSFRIILVVIDREMGDGPNDCDIVLKSLLKSKNHD